MYDTILVPTDGSDHAIRAAEHALYLGRAFDATVRVVNVVDVQGAGGLFDAGGVGEEFVARLEAEGEEVIEATIGDEEGIRTDVVRGNPPDAILDYADEHGVDLVAMGTQGRTGLDRLVAGSVTERVVRLSQMPVLTVRAVERSRVGDGYDEVLVPTDGSDPADAAVEHALAIASAADARVHAVNVVNLGDMATMPELSSPPAIYERLEAAREEATGSIARRAREAGLDAVTEVRPGSPARDLLEYARDHDIDLIAMGTHGRTGIDRVLIGSTAERVVRRAEVPVVAVTPDRGD